MDMFSRLKDAYVDQANGGDLFNSLGRPIRRVYMTSHSSPIFYFRDLFSI